MKELSKKFVEWVGFECYDGGNYLLCDFGKVLRFRTYGNYDWLTPNKLFEKFCIENNIDFENTLKLSYFDNNKFIPIDLLKYIAKKGLFLYRWTFKGVQQPSYWTNQKGDVKFTTDELYDEFIKTI